MAMQITKTLSQIPIILYLVCLFIATCMLSTPLKANKLELEGLCGCHTYRDTLLKKHTGEDSLAVRIALIYEDTIIFKPGKNRLQWCKKYFKDDFQEKEWTIYNHGGLLNKYADCYFEYDNRPYVLIFGYPMPISNRGLENDLKIKRRDLNTCGIKAQKYGTLLQLPTSERSPFIVIEVFIVLAIMVSKIVQNL